MAPSGYNFRLQKGIVRGFAPPTPTAIYVFTKSSGGSNLLISKQEQEDGTLISNPPSQISLEGEALSLVDELYNILKELPTEQPPGSEDIYEHDTSIAWSDDEFQWQIGSTDGVGNGESYVKPTPDQKKDFERAMEIVQSLADMAK